MIIFHDPSTTPTTPCDLPMRPPTTPLPKIWGVETSLTPRIDAPVLLISSSPTDPYPSLHHVLNDLTPELLYIVYTFSVPIPAIIIFLQPFSLSQCTLGVS